MPTTVLQVTTDPGLLNIAMALIHWLFIFEDALLTIPYNLPLNYQMGESFEKALKQSYQSFKPYLVPILKTFHFTYLFR